MYFQAQIQPVKFVKHLHFTLWAVLQALLLFFNLVCFFFFFPPLGFSPWLQIGTDSSVRKKSIPMNGSELEHWGNNPQRIQPWGLQSFIGPLQAFSPLHFTAVCACTCSAGQMKLGEEQLPDFLCKLTSFIWWSFLRYVLLRHRWWVSVSSGLHSKHQASQGYTVRLCLKIPLLNYACVSGWI